MTRVDFPNKTGDYNVDGVSIIILPDKIIVDTGARQTQQVQRTRNKSAYADEKPAKKSGAKKGDMLNTILDSCQEFVMPGSTKKGR